MYAQTCHYKISTTYGRFNSRIDCNYYSHHGRYFVSTLNEYFLSLIGNLFYSKNNHYK